MPEERTLLSTAPPSPEDWLAALHSVVPSGVVQVLPGAAAQLVAGDGTVLATVTRPRHVAVPTETRRLLGVDEPDRPWWTEVVAPRWDERVDAVVGALIERHAARLT